MITISGGKTELENFFDSMGVRLFFIPGTVCSYAGMRICVDPSLLVTDDSQYGLPQDVVDFINQPLTFKCEAFKPPEGSESK